MLSKNKSQRGMTMLECVVAMLLVGLGIGTCISMLQFSRSSAEAGNYRTIAVESAREIVNQMRANALGAPHYVCGAFSTTSNTLTSGCNWGSLTQSLVGNCINTGSTNCSPKDVAEANLITWAKQLGWMLPNGRGAIWRDNSLPFGEYIVSIAWDLVPTQADAGASTVPPTTSSTISKEISFRFSL